MPDTNSKAAQDLINAPEELTLKDHALYVKLSQAYVEQMLPTMAGRVFGTVVGLLSAFMAHKVTNFVFTAASLGSAGLAKAGAREIAVVSIKESTARTNLFTRVAGDMMAKFPTVARALTSNGKLSKSKLMFWATLGVVEDIAAGWDYLLPIMRRKMDAPESFFLNAEKNAMVLRQFGEALGAPVDSEGNGPFKDYILERKDTLVEYTISLDELCYDILWLEMVQNHIKEDVSVNHKQNPHLFGIQVWLASLLRHFLVNELDELTICPAFPFYGWLTGIPQEVADALDEVATNSLTLRDIMYAMGFTDAETFQSVGTSLISYGTEVGLGALQEVTHTKGILSLIGRKALLGGVKKLSPYMLRVSDFAD